MSWIFWISVLCLVVPVLFPYPNFDLSRIPYSFRIIFLKFNPYIFRFRTSYFQKLPYPYRYRYPFQKCFPYSVGIRSVFRLHQTTEYGIRIGTSEYGSTLQFVQNFKPMRQLLCTLSSCSVLGIYIIYNIYKFQEN